MSEEFETEQIEVFSPEQKELFGKLMSYLSGGGMFPGGSYQFRTPKVVNNAMSSFPEGNPWRGVSQSGVIPQMNAYPQQDRLASYRQAALSRGLGRNYGANTAPNPAYNSVSNPGVPQRIAAIPKVNAYALNQSAMTPNRALRNSGGR